MSFQIHTLGFFYGKMSRLNIGIIFFNMKNIVLLAIFVFAAILIFPQNIFAQEKASASSANINPTLEIKEGSDYRVKIARDYLTKYNSPLVDNAQDFIYYADLYKLDWRLVLAISGVESTYGKEIPENSYNAWGWGVYGDNVIRFKSWREGIQTVSQGLRERYMDEWGGQDIYEIGKIYASSPHWATSVNTHLTMIQKFILSNPQNALSLSL
jgi:hypothetical protein